MRILECNPLTSNLRFPNGITHPFVNSSSPLSVKSRFANAKSWVANRKFVRVASFRPGGGLGASCNVVKYEVYDLQVSEERNCGRIRICESSTVNESGGFRIGGGIIGKLI